MVELLFNALTQNKFMWTGLTASGISTCEITLTLGYVLTWPRISNYEYKLEDELVITQWTKNAKRTQT